MLVDIRIWLPPGIVMVRPCGRLLYVHTYLIVIHRDTVVSMLNLIIMYAIILFWCFS